MDRIVSLGRVEILDFSPTNVPKYLAVFCFFRGFQVLESSGTLSTFNDEVRSNKYVARFYDYLSSVSEWASSKVGSFELL